MDYKEAAAELGGELMVSEEAFLDKINRVKAFVFDWDGVFHAGRKGPGNNFAEADALGTNMLRFGYWLRNGELPAFGIITGQHNPAAIAYANRDHLQGVYSGILFKKVAIEHFCLTHDVAFENTSYGFDDILDLSVAELVGLRFLVRCTGSPLFREYCKESNYVDYVTGNDGGNHAVREIVELILSAWGIYPEVIERRRKFDEKYQAYLKERDAYQPVFYKWDGKEIVPE